jgi:chemotaxis protein MotA
MDIASLLGLIIAVGGCLAGYMAEGGVIKGLLSLSSGLIVLGATIGATFLSVPMKTIKEIPKLVKIVFFEQRIDYTELIDTITELAGIARKEGILALESRTKNMNNKFLSNGLNMVIDGMDKESIQSIIEVEINAISTRHARRAKIFEVAGGYCPTMGILGTVMSMISILKDLSDPGALGPKIAMAFTATLYGVGFANVLFLPMAEKLKSKAQDELISLEMIMEGILSIQAGESPKIIKEKLLVFTNEARKSVAEEKKNGEEA